MKTRTCPKCKSQFKRRKKGSCPNCHTPVFFLNGSTRLESDKLLTDTLLDTVALHVKKRDGVWVNMKIDPAERKAAYVYIDKARKFISKQQTYIESFEVCFIKWLLSNDVWWAKNLKSIRNITRSQERLMSEYYKVERHKANRKKLEQQRLQVLDTRQADIEFSI